MTAFLLSECKSRVRCRRPRRWPHPCGCSGFCCGNGGYRRALGTRCRRWHTGARRCRGAWTRRRSHCYWPAVTDERRSGGGTMPCCCYSCDWVYAPGRSRPSPLTMWTGGRASSWSERARHAGWSGCPCPTMSAPPWPPTCAMADPAVRLARCSCGAWLLGRPVEPGDVLGGASRLPGRRRGRIRSSSAPPPLGQRTVARRCSAAGDRTGPAAAQPIDDGDLRQDRPGRSGCGVAAVAGGGPVTALRDRAVEYLALRRALGFKLHCQGQLLLQFVDYTESHTAYWLSTDFAVAWARHRSGRTRRGRGTGGCR